MDIRELQYLIEIEKCGHLSKAANNLYVTQPALSRVLKKLEYEFDAPLFVRKGNSLIPTEVGEVILSAAKEIDHRFQKMYEDVKRVSTTKGESIHIGIPHTAGFPLAPAIAAFNAAYPNIDVILQECAGNDMARLMQENKLDVAFSIRPFPVDAVNEHLMVSTEVVVGFDKSHPWAKKEFITDADFMDQPYITADLSFQIGSQFAERLKKAGVTTQPKLSGTRAPWMINYAQSTGIPFVLSLPDAQTYGWPTMVFRSFKPVFPWQLCVFYPKSTTFASATNMFIQFFINYFHTAQTRPSDT